jgi:RND superfamily putative drug exporter
MLLDRLRSLVSRRPLLVVIGWMAAAIGVGVLAPDLSRLAAEGQANLMSKDAESIRAAEIVRQAWPDQSSDSMAVAAVHRPEGLTDHDRAYAGRLAERLDQSDRPREVLRVLGPNSAPEIAARLKSRDGTVQLFVVPMATSFVGPSTHRAVAWLRAQADAPSLNRPAGLQVRWTGDAAIGGDYMANVQTSLDRAAVVTLSLLLVVLLVVYRSVWLAMVPLATIVVSLVIARGALGWMTQAGWEISPLVELFLVAILFGTGTDFCLFISWRYGEHWNPRNPAGAMRVTLRRALVALLTSAGTVIVGLSLMGTTKFKLFSSTGPSVALGLALTLAATMTLTPALLVLLAKHRPRAFNGLTRPGSGFWDRFGRAALRRPLRSWALTIAFMCPLAVLGLRTWFVQDMVSELPRNAESGATLRLLAERFDPGMLAPLTVVLESESDLRCSEGLALIDDISRFLARQRRLVEVRSATQPLGSPKPLERARLASRLGEVDDGFSRLSDGAAQLQRGLSEGAAKLRAALWIEHNTGLTLAGPANGDDQHRDAARGAFVAGLKHASSALLGRGAVSAIRSAALARSESPASRTDDPRDLLLVELCRAAEGAGLIADGAGRAHREVASILRDPVGRRALDRLLITPETVKDHPELLESFAVYFSADGRRARIDMTQAERVFSGPAMDQVQTLRQKLDSYLSDVESPRVTASVTGTNAESADIRALTRSDQHQSWVLVPIGVFLVLIVALRDPLACVNLVATMVLTYAFALGATHLVFVSMLGAEGLDWKVPYFLFVLLVAVGVDYNVFLMARLREESDTMGLRSGIIRAVGQTGGLISSAAAITACSFASFLFSPLGSLRQLGFALVVGIAVDALLVRPLLVPCGHWLLARRREKNTQTHRVSSPAHAWTRLVRAAD